MQGLYFEDLSVGQSAELTRTVAEGAIYRHEIEALHESGRVCPVPYDPTLPVHTVWDLGKAVNNPIWCFQAVNGWLRIVDFYVPESEDLDDWVAWLDERGYHGNDYVPHDITAGEWGSSRTRMERLVALGRKPVRVAKVSVADGLQAGRMAINVAAFHAGDDERAERVAHGCEGLKAYRREWDDEFKTFRENPVKDWAEHIGSAWRYLGLAFRMPREEEPAKPKPWKLQGGVRFQAPKVARGKGARL